MELARLALAGSDVSTLFQKVSWEFSTHRALAAAAKSLQSCLTLCNPIDGSPPGSPVPGILQARVLEWGAISFSTRALGSSQILKYFFLPNMKREKRVSFFFLSMPFSSVMKMGKEINTQEKYERGVGANTYLFSIPLSWMNALQRRSIEVSHGNFSK